MYCRTFTNVSLQSIKGDKNTLKELNLGYQNERYFLLITILMYIVYLLSIFIRLSKTFIKNIESQESSAYEYGEKINILFNKTN